MRGNKSLADDLSVRQGAVSSRVALLLRSAEAKPSLPRFVLENSSPPVYGLAVMRSRIDWSCGDHIEGKTIWPPAYIGWNVLIFFSITKLTLKFSKYLLSYKR